MSHTRTVVTELLRRIAELYAEDADWRLNRPRHEHDRRDTPWITCRTGRAGAAAHYRDLAAHHVPERADTRVERVLVDGDDAVVLGEIRQTACPTGRPYHARFALHLTVRDGHVVRHHVPRRTAPRLRGQPAVAGAFAPRPGPGGLSPATAPSGPPAPASRSSTAAP
ncbi:nuclear transport factor 2 family protein [Streptomyces sp. NPDC059224]|uniref:nuclear transport factor 2 family protein n=1 Tax=Streptomyces sp. NPDC059224 TaxID=3346775 RepID=UPI003692B7E7